MMKPTNTFPFRLDNPRAWRTYLGGYKLDQLHGVENPSNSHFPEEWIMSVVCARNAGREHLVEEGMSHLWNSTITLKELLEEHPTYYLGSGYQSADLGVLVKLIDSAERLTLQVHPNKATAMTLFNSPFGKTECWHILETQEINGELPCIYLGFQEHVTKEHWIHLFETQDIEGMLEAMQKYYVKAGDTILIEGGIPHAIGAGCFLVEIQEPTDYTIRVERTTPSGLTVPDSMCHQGIGFERMFEVFHYNTLSREELYNRYFISPTLFWEQDDNKMYTLIGENNTDLFRLDELHIATSIEMTCVNRFSGLYILEGCGTISTGNHEEEIQAGQQYFVPVNALPFTISVKGNMLLRILHFYGPN